MRATDIRVAKDGELWIGSRNDKDGGDSCRYESKADISLYGLENGYIPKDPNNKNNGSKMKNPGFGWRFLQASQGSGKSYLYFQQQFSAKHCVCITDYFLIVWN